MKKIKLKESNYYEGYWFYNFYNSKNEPIDTFTVVNDGKVKTYELYVRNNIRERRNEYYALLSEGCPYYNDPKYEDCIPAVYDCNKKKGLYRKNEIKKHYFIIFDTKKDWYNLKDDFYNNPESEKTEVKVYFNNRDGHYSVTNGVFYREFKIKFQDDIDPIDAFKHYCEVANIDMSSEMIYDDNNWSLVKNLETNEE